MADQLPPIYEHRDLCAYIKTRTDRNLLHVHNLSTNVFIHVDTNIVELTLEQRNSVLLAKTHYIWHKSFCVEFRKLSCPYPQTISIKKSSENSSCFTIRTQDLIDLDLKDLSFRCILSQDFPDGPVSWGGPIIPPF